MDDQDRKFFQENNVTFQGGEYYSKPIYDYLHDSRFTGPIRDSLERLKYLKPTPIQGVAIPTVLAGKDFIGISQTGSGKTLAFLLPAFIKMMEGSLEQNFGSPHRPVMMVLAPTRELALQTKEVIDNFDMYKAVCLYGGDSRYTQVQICKNQRPPIVVGTPGRINDLLDASILEVDKVKYFVLDEADRMFDMGFYPQISKIINQCTVQDRQTLLFSATWEGKVEPLAEPFLKRDRVFACIGQLKLKANTDIRQHLFLCTDYQKKSLLRKILQEFDGFKVIVFANTKARTSDLASFSDASGIGRTEFIHGDVDQSRRTRLVKDFDNNKFTVLFATDVASRGLDIDDIQVVINYDIPNDVETYVHRIGRTGRNGKKGKAFTLVTHQIFQNSYNHRQLVKVVRESGNQVPDNLMC